MTPQEIHDAIPGGHEMSMLQICDRLSASVASVAPALHEALLMGIVRPVVHGGIVGRYRRREDDPVPAGGIGGALP